MAFFALLFTALSGGASPASAPEDALATRVRTFLAAADAWDEEALRSAADGLADVAKERPESFEAQYWTGVAHFHVLLRGGKEAEYRVTTREARQAAEEADEALRRALSLRRDDAESHAMLGVLSGMRIGGNPVAALRHGREVMRHKREALEHGETNPRVHYLLGASYYHGPSLLGGRDKALEHLLRAEALYESEAGHEQNALQPAWGRGACLSFIARLHDERGDTKAAEEYYRKALDVNPRDRNALEALRMAAAEQPGEGSRNGG